MSEALKHESLPALAEDSVVEAAPAWGAEDEDATTLDGLVAPTDSWLPVEEDDQLLASVHPPPPALLPADLRPPPPRRPPPDRIPDGPPSPRAMPPLPLASAPTTETSVQISAPEPPSIVTVQLGSQPRRPPWAVGAIVAGTLLLAGSVWALAGGDAAEAATQVAAPPPAAAEQAARPPPATPAAPAPTPAAADAPTSAPPAADTPPAAPKAALPTDDSDLKPNEGGLLVHSQAGLRVFIQGVERGRTNERVVLPCGYRFVRLQGASAGVWVSEGVSVLVTCKTTTEVELKAEPAG